MPTLAEILNHESQVKSIIELARLHGFERIRVSKETVNGGALVLLGSAISEEKNYTVFLETCLTEVFNCKISVLTEQHLKSEIKNNFILNSAPINDKNAVQNLFNQPLEQIVLRSEIQNENQKKLHEVRMKSAHDFLSGHQRKLTNFFQVAPSPQTPQMKTTDVPNKTNELTRIFTDSHNFPLVEKTIQELSPETINKIHN